jgi:hypothetical protein
MGHGAAATSFHRQAWLRAIECLDLAHMGTPPVKIVGSGSVLHGKSPAVVAAYPRSEPTRMTRPVSDAGSNSHPVAALVGCTNIPLASGKGSGGRNHSFLRLRSQARSRSAHLDPPEPIKLWKIGNDWFSWFSDSRHFGALQYNSGGHIFPERDQQLPC